MAMKMICDQAALADALNTVGSVVASRTPSPVLTCVKLTAADGRLRLAATDGETSLVLDLDRVEVESAGEVLVPADKLTQIIRECADPTIALEADGHALHIRGNDARFKVFGFDPKEAPPEATFDDANVDCTSRLGQACLCGRTKFVCRQRRSTRDTPSTACCTTVKASVFEWWRRTAVGWLWRSPTATVPMVKRVASFPPRRWVCFAE